MYIFFKKLCICVCTLLVCIAGNFAEAVVGCPIPSSHCYQFVAGQDCNKRAISWCGHLSNEDPRVGTPVIAVNGSCGHTIILLIIAPYGEDLSPQCS